MVKIFLLITAAAAARTQFLLPHLGKTALLVDSAIPLRDDL
jgi:hypothetical protein